MPELLRPDLCVIGAGAGGLSVAAGAAVLGASVVLVEKGRMGGDCLHSGCVPSKSLIAAARHAHAIALAPAFGVSAGAPLVDFLKVREHIRAVIAAIEPNDSKERFTGLGVRVIEGAARFKNRRTLLVGEDITIRARRFVIATGSRPALPPIAGLESVPALTNETVFDLAECPAHLIIIGAGAVGLELAQAFRRLGSAVTVLEANEPLAAEERECADVVLDALMREGIVLRAGVTITGVDAYAGEDGLTTIRLTLRDGEAEETLTGSHLLVAAGRRADTDELGLAAARIKHVNGAVMVNERLRTSNRRVYAVGDAVGEQQLTHVASYHAAIVIRNLFFRLRSKVNADLIPRVTFTDPELAHVGLTEADARARGIRMHVLRWPYDENDRAQAERTTPGHIKVITDARGGVLGCSIVGAGAGELITAWSLAVHQGLNIRAFASMIVPYPTLAEVGKRAATTYFTASLARPWVRGIIDLLRRWG